VNVAQDKVRLKRNFDLKGVISGNNCEGGGI
jgi:hypothetical protein